MLAGLECVRSCNASRKVFAGCLSFELESLTAHSSAQRCLCYTTRSGVSTPSDTPPRGRKERERKARGDWRGERKESEEGDSSGSL